jgi:hypothetical protein
MTATIWLILSLGTAMMHVGTFDSMEACQKAARTVWSERGQAAVACVPTGTLR